MYSFPCVCTLIDNRWCHQMFKKWNNEHSELFHCTVLNILWRHLLSIRASTDAWKTVHDLFFTTNLNRQAGRDLKFEGNCGVKQTKKRAVLFCVTFENTSAIINNFSQHLIGLFCLQTKGSIFIGHKNDRWLTQWTLAWLVNKLTDWICFQTCPTSSWSETFYHSGM